MTRHESSIVVDRPIEEVWAFVTDPFSAARMGGGRLRIRLTSPGPLGVGSSIQQRVAIVGFETNLNTVVTEYDPPNALTHTAPPGSNAGAFRSARFRTSLERDAGGTRVVRTAEMEPRGILRILWPVLWPLLMPRMEAQTRNLKRLLEAGGRQGPA